MGTDNQINIMEMARKAVAYEQLIEYLRKHIWRTQEIDLVCYDANSAKPMWFVIDMSRSNKGAKLFKSNDLHACLDWLFDSQAVSDGRTKLN